MSSLSRYFSTAKDVVLALTTMGGRSPDTADIRTLLDKHTDDGLSVAAAW